MDLRDPTTEPSDHRRSASTFPFDTGWLFLLAGCAILVATVLIPAIDDLAQARQDRDLALSYEHHREARLANYRDFAARLSQPDDDLVLHLARTQLNLVPDDEEPIVLPADLGDQSASLLPDLEPRYLEPAYESPRDTLLRRWATGSRSRLWLIAGGALCVLIGLLPPARR
jgi:hypothetical protein